MSKNGKMQKIPKKKEVVYNMKICMIKGYKVYSGIRNRK